MAEQSSVNGRVGTRGLSTQEQTGAQVYVFGGPVDRALPKRRSPISAYKKYREMRRDPTLALARAMVCAPILVSEWSVEVKEGATEPEGATDLIKEVFVGMREHVLENVLRGLLDYGWQGFEKVFDAQTMQLTKLKPLLQDLTEILVVEDTGAFDGLRQGDLDLELQNTLLFSNDAEGTNWYGTPILFPAEQPYDEWWEVNDAARKYEKKIAGSHWIVYYPEGQTRVNGVMTDNGDIAKQIIAALTGSGAVAVPRAALDALDEITEGESAKSGWEIKLETDGGAGATTFVERQNYLDKLKVRALGVPERAVLEGQFGTKAESAVHGDFAITNVELRHRSIVRVVNWHAVDQQLEISYGPEARGVVYLRPAPLSDDTKARLAALYQAIILNPEGFSQEMAELDTDAVRERLGFPTRPAGEAEDMRQQMLADQEVDDEVPVP